MKNLLLIIMAGVMLSSCAQIRRSTSKSIDVNTTIESVSTAELSISETKVIYDYIPTKKERKRLKEKTLIEKAVAAALVQSGNADVMVATEYDIDTRRGSIRKIVVKGYPAKYQNFKLKEKSNFHN